MYRNFCVVVALVSIVYGIGYTVVPGLVANLYYDSPNGQVVAMGRYFGLTLLGVGVLLWLLRDVSDIVVKNAVLINMLVVGVLGCITSVWLVLNGTLEPFGWSAAVIYLIITVWSLLIKKSVSQEIVPG